MRFTKIKWNGKEVVLAWTTKSGADTIRHTLDSFERPRQEFDDALQAFVPEIVQLLELPTAYAEELKVIGLSINYEEGDRAGLVVTCLKNLAEFNAPLVLNTPHMREPDFDDENPGQMSDTVLQLLGRAQGAATRYVEGKREQGDLFEAESEPAAGRPELVTT